MTIINFCGFETGDNAEAAVTQGTFSVQGTTKYSGSYALRVNPTTTAIGYHKIGRQTATLGINGALNLETAFFEFRFCYASKPSSNDEIFAQIMAATSSLKLELRLNSAGKIAAYNSADPPVLMATGNTVLAADTWYRIGIKCGTGASAPWEVWLAEGDAAFGATLEISGTGNLTIANSNYIGLGKVINRNANSVDFYYDDLVIDDAGFPGGDGRCFLLAATGEGYYTGWTGAYTDVDEIPPDTATYLATTTNLAARTVNVQDCAALGITKPIAVKACAIVNEPVSATSAVASRARSGSTDDDTTNSNLTATYILKGRVYTRDPADSAVWTTAKVNALEVGVKNNSTEGVAVRCTSLFATVWDGSGTQISGGAALSASGTVAASATVIEPPAVEGAASLSGKGTVAPDMLVATMASGENIPHGSGYAASVDRVYISGRVTPYKLYRFQPSDLTYSVYTAPAGRKTAPALRVVGSVVYVATMDATVTRVDRFTTSNDPPTLDGSWDLGAYGQAAAIDSDGTYLYVGTEGRRVLKVRISDGAVVANRLLTDLGDLTVHALRYDSETSQVFCTTQNGYMYRLAAADLAETQSATLAVSVSDDLGLTTGYVWVPVEAIIGRVTKVSKTDLAARTNLDIGPAAGSYGCFEDPDGVHVWSPWAAKQPPRLSRIKVSDSSVEQFYIPDDDTGNGQANEIVFCPGVDRMVVSLYGIAPFKMVSFTELLHNWPRATVTYVGTAALTGSGTVTASATIIREGAAVLSGSGTASATAGVIRPAAAAVSGVGTATAAARLTLPASAVLAGAGAANATGVRTMAGQSAPAGAGTLSVVGHATRNTAAAISASGTVAAAGRITRAGAAALAGSGTVGAVASVGAEAIGRADVSASGSLSAAALVVRVCDDQVDASLDDAHEWEDSGLMGAIEPFTRLDSNTIPLGRYWGGFRFHNGPFPDRGATIVAAYIDLYCDLLANDDLNTDIHCQAASSPDTFVDSIFGQPETWYNITPRPRTTTFVPWVAFNVGLGWQRSPSLVPIFQELVDNFTPTAIAVITKPKSDSNHQFRLTSYDGDAALSAKLHLEWIPSCWGAASLSGSGTTDCAAQVVGSAGAALAASGTVVAAGEVTRRGAAAIAGAGAVAAIGTRTTQGAASVEAAGAITASGQLVVVAQAAVSGEGTAGASGACIRRAVSALVGAGTISATAGQMAWAGKAAVAGEGALTAYAETGGERLGRADLSGGGALVAHGTQVHRATGSASGAGELTAGGHVTRLGASILTGSGTLTASAVIAVVLGQAAVAGGGSVVVAGHITRATGAAVAGTGSLAAAGQVTVVGQAVLAGAGAASASGVRTRPGAAAISGAGGLAASARIIWSAKAVLAGNGTLTAQAETGAERLGRADLSGAGAILVYGTQVVACQATVAGQGTLTPAGHVTKSAAVALSGAGAVSTSAQRGTVGQIALSGTSTATAAGARTVRAAAVLSAEGTLAAQGESAGEALGRAELSGTATLTASGTQVHRAIAVVAGEGTLTAVSVRGQQGAAAVGGAGGLAVAGVRTVPGAAAVSGSGTASGRGAATLPAASALAGSGTLAAQAEVGSERLGRADLGGAGALVVYGTQVHGVAATIAGEGSLASSGKVTRAASAAPSGSGSLTASGLLTRTGAVAVGAQGTLTAAGVRTVRALASLEGAGALAAQAEVGGEALGRADLSGAGAVAAAGVRTLPAAAALGGAGTVAAAAVLLRFLTPDQVEGFCGQDVGAEATKSIDDDTDAYWRHSATENHWIIFDLATEQDVFKIRIYQSALAAERWGGG